MSKVEVGKKIPAFSAEATSEITVKPGALKGKNWVLYFYPKDNTPGCTTEGQDFRDAYPEFEQANTVVFGVSRDSLRTHENFKAKHEFPFELISDPNEELCLLFDVMRMKNMYGKQVRGVERSTFLVDASGKLRQEWRKVRVKGHVAEVLAAAQTLQG